ncbi:TOX high mobility group box family member 4-A [Hibiscus syriacus]|uniref:TOX high mobility group box family member 4-A n=1 Tax=Hibiscus syriacus TaxID=106335 RepID=A0A6A2X6D6_HIBSY|nr:uncharacterized protein LOC120174930 [Hibiscus syriacus]KAE8670468.1 TOX high mobility group box family member 4-A [Hibiscus syriacus]
MEDLGSFWNYQESFDDLKLKLQYTAMELHSSKMEANEQIRKYKEELKRMLNLLNLAYQERDEARDQLQKLLNKLMPCETPFMIAAKTNSSITESNSLSDAYNNHSSPVDSLFDAVNSPDFPAVKMNDPSGMGLLNQPFGLVPSMVMTTKFNGETAVINNLAKGKTLPEKGKLLQAVMEAGPLLSTLLVAGPLPQWRNPPPSETFKIPPVSISKTENETRKRVNSSLCPKMTRGTHQMCSSAMLSFATSGSASGLSHSPIVSTSACANTQITVTKRQRI